MLSSRVTAEALLSSGLRLCYRTVLSSMCVASSSLSGCGTISTRVQSANDALFSSCQLLDFDREVSSDFRFR
jgi:hypothetical protein